MELLESIKQAILEIDNMEKDLLKLDMNDDMCEADIHRYNEIRERINNFKKRMNDTHRHNIQQLRECTKAMVKLGENDNELIWYRNRKLFLFNEIKTYREWLKD